METGEDRSFCETLFKHCTLGSYSIPGDGGVNLIYIDLDTDTGNNTQVNVLGRGRLHQV